MFTWTQHWSSKFPGLQPIQGGNHYPSFECFPLQNKQRISMVSKAYENIRNLIHGNSRVAMETKLQLPQLGQGTFIQW
ncbi:hypothetical protein DPMN_144021 [Dreissena polymorpha]|uniref:Uncharacterized protein n=1 Tax=Dreissena polymorpha TaxID=45954 RepID=A0A9D4GEU3_DREPO|nr:hypothetical protein DPMN_144021 [Dreissena polymorpha]